MPLSAGYTISHTVLACKRGYFLPLFVNCTDGFYVMKYILSLPG